MLKPTTAFTRAVLPACCFALSVLSAQAAQAATAADNYPSRPLRIITPAQPGGTTDYLARLLAARLTEVWKQQAVVDNRGSASGVNGAEITKNAAPDGYTLFLVYHQHIINAAKALGFSYRYMWPGAAPAAARRALSNVSKAPSIASASARYAASYDVRRWRSARSIAETSMGRSTCMVSRSN